jgi:hypothetical protein
VQVELAAHTVLTTHRHSRCGDGNGGPGSSSRGLKLVNIGSDFG